MKVACVVSAMILASVVLPTPGRAPEDHRAGVVALDLNAERFAGTDQVLLADKFVKGARPHSSRLAERSRSAVWRLGGVWWLGLGIGLVVEEAHGRGISGWVKCLASPTLAAKTKTRRGWGTRDLQEGERAWMHSWSPTLPQRNRGRMGQPWILARLILPSLPLAALRLRRAVRWPRRLRSSSQPGRGRGW